MCTWAAFNERSFGGMLANSFERSKIRIKTNIEKIGLPQIFNLWEKGGVAVVLICKANFLRQAHSDDEGTGVR